MTDADVPWCRLPAPSTTEVDETGKIPKRPKGGRARRRQAASLPGMRLYGINCPVSLTFVIRVSSETWIEVSNHEGRFFVRHDASLLALLRQVQVGGHYVTDRPSTSRRPKSGKEQKK